MQLDAGVNSIWVSYCCCLTTNLWCVECVPKSRPPRLLLHMPLALGRVWRGMEFMEFGNPSLFLLCTVISGGWECFFFAGERRVLKLLGRSSGATRLKTNSCPPRTQAASAERGIDGIWQPIVIFAVCHHIRRIGVYFFWREEGAAITWTSVRGDACENKFLPAPDAGSVCRMRLSCQVTVGRLGIATMHTVIHRTWILQYLTP